MTFLRDWIYKISAQFPLIFCPPHNKADTFLNKTPCFADILAGCVVCINVDGRYTMKKSELYVMLLVLLCLVPFFILCIHSNNNTGQSGEKADMEDYYSFIEEEYANDCPDCMYWDGKYYQRIEKIDEKEVKPDKLGEITEHIDISGMPEKNGQSNSLNIPVGAEIYPMLDGKDLAMYVNGEWWLLQYQEEIWLQPQKRGR